MIPAVSNLLEMLSRNDFTFFIPPYQRNYEWNDIQCRAFLEDLIKTAKINAAGGTAKHFFGTITFYEVPVGFGLPRQLVLIDGQQRITTTMLLMAALRDITDDVNVIKAINDRYLKNQAAGPNTEYKIKLKQVETDWEVYKKIVLSQKLDDNELNAVVCRNYAYFKNKLSEYREDGGDLSQLLSLGLDRFNVITITLQPDICPWEKPQEIFESLNSLGKPLSLADLVRNYIFLGLDPATQDKLYKSHWLHIEKALPNHVSDFVRDFMQAHEMKSFVKSTESNYKELYSSFKNIFGGSDAQTLMQDLSDYADIYKVLINGTGSGDAVTDVYLADLNQLSVTTSYSFLMVLFYAWKKQNKFSAKDIQDILSAFRIYCLRRRILGITNAENKNFPGLARQVQQLVSAADKKTEMFKILSQQENNMRLPNDIEMKQFLEGMNFYNFRYCKFYLSLVEEALTKNRPGKNDDDKLQIEHIMPKTLNDPWKQMLGNDYAIDHQKYINTIGNLTLIRHNQELGNKAFSEKLVIYKNNAGLQIAQTNITNKRVWNKKAITDRAAWLIPFLVENVMPIPQQMRNTNNFKVVTGKYLSFQQLQIIGENINFIGDPSVVARVVGDTDVEFEGKNWKLSALTKEIMTRKGTASSSGSYQGARYWEYDGMRLLDVM